MGLKYEGVFEGWEIAVAKKLVDQFKRKWKCFFKDDFDDLLQECLSHWYFVRKRYEASKGASKSSRKLTGILTGSTRLSTSSYTNL